MVMKKRMMMMMLKKKKKMKKKKKKKKKSDINDFIQSLFYLSEVICRSLRTIEQDIWLCSFALAVSLPVSHSNCNVSMRSGPEIQTIDNKLTLRSSFTVCYRMSLWVNIEHHIPISF